MFIKPKKKYLKKILPVGCILAFILSWCSFAYSIPDEISIIKGKEVVAGRDSRRKYWSIKCK